MKWAQDCLALGGAGMLVSGAWWVYPPAGLIVAGLLALALGFVWGLSE